MQLLHWLFWLSITSRVLFLYICLLFCTFIIHHTFFDHLRNCSKFPGLTISQPVNAHFILLPRLFGTRFQAAFITLLVSCNSRLIWKCICFFKLFLIHSFCVIFLFFVHSEFFGRLLSLLLIVSKFCSTHTAMVWNWNLHSADIFTLVCIDLDFGSLQWSAFIWICALVQGASA